MLEVRNLVVRYGRVEAVRQLSLQVQRGEIVCLVGSNGAGKSSAIKGILGLAESAEGEVLFNGADLTRQPTPRRVAAGLALVPEGRHVFALMSVRENLLLGAASAPPDAVQSRLAEMLEMFPVLAERINQAAGTMSGGEQQMVAIARALMSAPSVLLLDEPTLGLSPVMVERVAQVLVRLRGQGLAILLAEQNLTMALGIADRGYVLETGSVVVTDTAANLRADTRVRQAYLGDA